MAKKKRRREQTETAESSYHSKPEISIDLLASPPLLQQLPSKNERRREVRYRVELEVVIFFSGISFRTKTINLSTQGLLLAESIPSEFVGQTLDIVLIEHSGHIRDFFLVKGKGLEAPLRSPRIVFLDLLDLQRQKIRELLEDRTPVVA